MFTFKPASKNSPSGNGHKADNGNGNGWLGLGASPKLANSTTHSNGNGHSSKIESVLGPGINYQGTLTGTGGIRIEGSFDGAISIKGPLVVADGAKVTADIQASAVTVAGSVKGNITAAKVEIQSTGRVWGDLITTAFATEEGAFLRGQVRMEDQVPDEAPVLAPVPVPAAPGAAPIPQPETLRPAPSFKPNTGWSR
ncbi:MAG: polymer-forming cytoskeletal protein [Anaerolineales bacterium]